MHKNLHRILIITILILAISACSGSGGGSGGNRPAPPTTGEIKIPNNYVKTTSSNLFLIPLTNKTATVLAFNTG